MKLRQVRVRVLDRKGELLEDRCFLRVSKALRFIEEQVRLGRSLKVECDRDLGLGSSRPMRWPTFSGD